MLFLAFFLRGSPGSRITAGAVGTLFVMMQRRRASLNAGFARGWTQAGVGSVSFMPDWFLLSGRW